MKKTATFVILALIGSVIFSQCSPKDEIEIPIVDAPEKDSIVPDDNDSIVTDSIVTDSITTDTVIIAEKPNPLLELIESDSSITIFCEALKITGLDIQLELSVDSAYNPGLYSRYYYTSDFWREVATVPDKKMNAFTLFVETDMVLKTKYGVNDIQDLIVLAKTIYDETYSEDAGLYDEDFTHPKNPLYRFVAYHILKRDVRDLNLLTGRILNKGIVRGPIGIKTNLMNPIEWYQTLLPNTMMKCEMLTVRKWLDESSTLRNYYINRRWDDTYQFRGSEVAEPNGESATINGRYFYIDDLLAFTTDIRDKVQNMLIRMDFSTVFPELMSQGIRQNGDPTKDDNSSVADETFQNGKNYWFPDGYLDGLKVKKGYVVYRRPHWNFWNYQGDEFNLFGDYDIEVSLPPVPFSGEWQVRLGYCALGTRGIAQIYYDGIPQGDPLDMRIYLDDEQILGTAFGNYNSYFSMSIQERILDQKALKEKGYYRGPYGGYHTDGNVMNEFVTNPRTYRKVIYQGYMDHTKTHFLRIEQIGGKIGNNNEFGLDYIELVPKIVYDIPEGCMESDL